MATVGVVVNPAAGRDVRRLAGGAVVSGNYAKRRIAEAVIEGLTMVDASPDALVMRDKVGIGEYVVRHAPADVDARLLEMPVRGDVEDTHRAADLFQDNADAVVVLGGDGTTRAVANSVGSVPIAAVSTGTNNVVPSFVDGTAAGAAGALVATDAVPLEDVSFRHGMVEVTVEETGQSTRGVATAGVVDRPFVGSRAVMHASEFVGGVVSRASPDDVGLSGIAGTGGIHAPDAEGGVLVRLTPPGPDVRTVRAIPLPGVVEPVGVRERRVLEDRETATFSVSSGVVSVDGERELEVTDSDVVFRPVADGPTVVRFDDVFDAAVRRGCFEA